MIRISNQVELPDSELEWKAVRSGGPGGQHVNKVATTVQLSFDIGRSSLPDFYKERLLKMNHHHITDDGRIQLQVSDSRSQEKNRAEALRKFTLLVRSAAVTRRKRKKTKPTRASVRRRVEGKRRRSEKKSLRKRPRIE